MTHLTIEDLILCEPFFFSKLLTSRHTAHHIFQHISLDEIEPNMNTLLLLKSVDESIPLLEAALQNTNISGIIIYGLNPIYLPSVLENLAKEKEKPLLFLKNPDGVGLKQRILEILQLKSENLFHFATSQISNYWLDLLNRKDIKEMIKRLDFFLGTEVIFFNTQKVFQNIRPSIYTKKDFKNLKVIRDDKENLPENFTMVDNGEHIYYLFKMLSPNKKIIGYFLFKKQSEPLSEFQITLLRSIVPAMVTWVKQTAITRSVHLKYKDQFLYDILNNNIDSEQEMIEMAKLWNMDFTPNAQVFAIDLNDSIPITKDVIIKIQNLLQPDGVPFKIYTTYLSHRIVGVVFPITDKDAPTRKETFEAWLMRIQNKFKKVLPELKTIIGIGRIHQSNLEIYQSFQEAKISLQMYDYILDTKGIIHYDEIGYIRLLSYIHNDLLSDFSTQYLHPLILHDKENETDLIDTLYAYCNHNGDIIQTAHDLFIHPNTLRQRLKKIESVLQVDLNNYTDMVNLILALKIEKNINV